MKAVVSILDALRDPALFAPSFPLPTWRPWLCCAAVLFGLTDRLTESEQTFARACLGGRSLPDSPVAEAWLIIGRRGGKSRFAAVLAIFLACFRDYRSVLSSGERGVVMIIAADRRQAGVVHRYISALLHSVPMLEALIANETKESIELTNRIVVEVHTASFRSIRGRTVVGAICDEVAFWRSEDSANPDTEILNALRPSTATVPGAMVLAISSPYARKGELWRAYRNHYGHAHDRIVVWKADTRTMNPSVPQAFVDQAYAEDAAVAGAEYGAEFRGDLESFVSQDAIDAVTVDGRRELPVMGNATYTAFCDPSGGSRDSMTLAIAHREKTHAVLDVVREVKPPFSPEGVVKDFSDVLQQYRVRRVCGDRFAGQWPRERFQKCGIHYEASTKPKSTLYAELLPAINSGRVELLDLPRLRSQLGQLERRTARGGRDSIDHPPQGHDDVGNAVAGVLVDVLSRAASEVSVKQIMAINRRAAGYQPPRPIF